MANTIAMRAKMSLKNAASISTTGNTMKTLFRGRRAVSFTLELAP
jgi:hypothetical protein